MKKRILQLVGVLPRAEISMRMSLVDGIPHHIACSDNRSRRDVSNHCLVRSTSSHQPAEFGASNIASLNKKRVGSDA
ncbi:hypothetical protein VNO77_27038 [Canavalia gladiata]|uniref:Uncharacterized protein n=1 Tax=Canavalia gladiata TaxID=3824 RepID=A0AAN9KV19_CANGL